MGKMNSLPVNPGMICGWPGCTATTEEKTYFCLVDACVNDRFWCRALNVHHDGSPLTPEESYALDWKGRRANQLRAGWFHTTVGRAYLKDKPRRRRIERMHLTKQWALDYDRVMRQNAEYAARLWATAADDLDPEIQDLVETQRRDDNRRQIQHGGVVSMDAPVNRHDGATSNWSVFSPVTPQWSDPVGNIACGYADSDAEMLEWVSLDKIDV